MEELLNTEKQDLQKRLQKAMEQFSKWQTIAMQLEGAILHCDEMLKKIEDGNKASS